MLPKLLSKNLYARLAYRLCIAPFGGENHAFFMFILFAITHLDDNDRNVTFNSTKYQTAWERFVKECDAAIKNDCLEEFKSELHNIYNERIKFDL